MVIPRFVERALANTPLEIYGDGHQTRCFCHVKDTVRALVGLMGDESASGEIYNVGSEERIRIIDLAQRVIAATGSTSDVEFLEYDRVYGHGIEDMLHRIPSIEKVSAAIDWRPERTLDEILADVIEHVRTAPALAEV
jgi:UDP-glucose 4-epimerase